MGSPMLGREIRAMVRRYLDLCVANHRTNELALIEDILKPVADDMYPMETGKVEKLVIHSITQRLNQPRRGQLKFGVSKSQDGDQKQRTQVRLLDKKYIREPITEKNAVT